MGNAEGNADENGKESEAIIGEKITGQGTNAENQTLLILELARQHSKRAETRVVSRGCSPSRTENFNASPFPAPAAQTFSQGHAITAVFLSRND